MSDYADRFRSRNSSSNLTRYQPLQLENELEDRRKIFKQKQYRKLCWAGSLTILGLLMTITGLYMFTYGNKGSTPFLMVGFITLLPGAYGIYEVSRIFS
jgi:hypothetical protein